MPPNLPEAAIRQVAEWVAAYIAEQRSFFLGQASPLLAEHRKKMSAFSPDDVLNTVRITRGRAKEPSFYTRLRAMGIRNAPSFSDMAGVTFQDVVLHVDALTEKLLFHELIHVVQYKHLGLRGFAELYVRGFLNGGSYEEIPLEKQAYALEAKFSASPEDPFSAEADVVARIRSRLF